MSTPLSLHDALERAKSALEARIDQSRQFKMQQEIDNDRAALEVLSHVHVSAAPNPVSLSKQDRFVQLCAETWNGAYPDRRHWDDIGEEAQSKWIRVFRLHAALINSHLASDVPAVLPLCRKCDDTGRRWDGDPCAGTEGLVPCECQKAV